MRYDKCLKCTNRFLGCHSTCEDYKHYKKVLEIIKKNRKDSQLESRNRYKRRRRNER